MTPPSRNGVGRKPPMPRPAVVSATFARVVPSPGTCMVCGCTDDRACPGGCSWVDERQTICSACTESLIETVSDWFRERASK